jgi:casein kinase I family protein HRR25
VEIHLPQLEYETRVHSILAGGIGIPSIHWSGVDKGYRAMVFDQLGRNLEELFIYCHHKFSLKTVLLLADQLLCRLESIHAKSIILGDVRPENFRIGKDKLEDQVQVASFRCARRYETSKGCHVPYSANSPLNGTPRYASLNTHRRIPQTRRDDLASLGYNLIYFCKGSLPWQSLNPSTKHQVCDRIMKAKMATSTEVLCRGLPSEFAMFLDYAQSLEFSQEPNYHFCRKMFRDLYDRESYGPAVVFDWVAYHVCRNGESSRAGLNGSVGGPSGSFTLLEFVPYGKHGVLAQPKLKSLKMEGLIYDVECFPLPLVGCNFQADSLLGIYKRLVEEETQCKQNLPVGSENLSDEQWQTLLRSHRGLLHSHHDFLITSHQFMSPPTLRGLVAERNILSRLWHHGIRTFLELLMRSLPETVDYMQAFLRLSYAIIRSLMERIPGLKDFWPERLAEVAKYRMIIESGAQNRAIWYNVAQTWSRRATEIFRGTGLPGQSFMTASTGGCSQATSGLDFDILSLSLTSTSPSSTTKPNVTNDGNEDVVRHSWGEEQEEQQEEENLPKEEEVKSEAD